MTSPRGNHRRQSVAARFFAVARRRKGVVALALACGWVAGQIVSPFLVPTERGDPGSPVLANRPDAPATTLAFRVRPANDFRMIAERPLFSSTRAPAASVEDIGERAAGEQPDVRFTGFVFTERKRATVVLDGGEPRIIAEGDVIAGWRVREIARRELVLERSGRRITAPYEGVTKEALSKANQSAREMRRRDAATLKGTSERETDDYGASEYMVDYDGG